MKKIVIFALAIYSILLVVFALSQFQVIHINPYLLNIEFIKIRWYGALIALGILLSYLITINLLKNKYSENQIDSSFLIIVFMGLIGARLGFVIQNTAYYASKPLGIIKIYDGGLSIHGAIILGLIGLLIAAKKYKLKIMEFANAFVPQILLAGAIGRWGNFFNQEIVGKPTEKFLKIFIDEENRPIGYERFPHFMPVFLYESLVLLLTYIIYIIFLRKKNIGLIYTLSVYSAIRIVVEFLRIDYKPILWIFDLAQIVSFAIIIVSIIFYIFYRRKDGRKTI